MIPLEVYIAHGLAKVMIALCQGKKNYDKREAMKIEDQKNYAKKVINRY